MTSLFRAGSGSVRLTDTESGRVMMFRYFCETCGLTCNSLKNLTDHVLGKVHRAALSHVSPGEVDQLGRLQYFLDRFMKEQPILGLEHVQEKRLSDSYVYACRLCDVGLEWRQMVLHVMDVKHIERYIRKRHSYYLRAFPDGADDNERRTALFKLAFKIHSKFGRKGIRIALERSSLPEVACPSPEGDVLCSTEDDGDTAAALPQGEPSERPKIPTKCLRKLFKSLDPTLLSCWMCGVTCQSAVALCEHVQGKAHKNTMEVMLPDEVKELGRLGYFLNNHMNGAVILGLEYLVEVNLGTTYKFTCRLCNVDTTLLNIVGHITDLEHVECYIGKHHAHLLPNLATFDWEDYCKALRDASVMIYEKHGRQEIQVKNIPVKDHPEEGDDKTQYSLQDEARYFPQSTHSSENTSYSKPLTYQKSEGPNSQNMFKQSTVDGPPFATMGVFPNDNNALSSKETVSKYRSSHFDERQSQYTHRHLINLTCLAPVKELEFNTKNDFLEYSAAAKQESRHLSEAALLYRRTDRETVDIHDREEADREKYIYRSHTKRTPIDSPDIHLREKETEWHKSSYPPKAPLTRKYRTDKQTPYIEYWEREKERHRSRHLPDSRLASESRAYKESPDARFGDSKRQKSSHWPETSLASLSRADRDYRY